MEKILFNVEKDGFYGAYYPNKCKSKCAIIACLGDDSEDYMARTAVKWLHERKVNVLMMSPDKKNYSHHNYPLERIENAITWLKENENEKIGFVGASTTGTLALVCASMFPSITLTIALTPSDFVWQGFMQGKRDGYTEWPIENESLFTYKGKILPYMPFCYKHPEYGKVIKEESKKNKDMINSLKLFDDSELKHPLLEEEMIKVENIKGTLVLVGAEDDALWNTVKYINRMKERLNKYKHECDVKIFTYKYGTHYVFPQSMIKKMFPVGSGLFLKLAFKSAREHPKECKATRIDIDKQINSIIKTWVI